MVQEGALTALASAADSSQVQEEIFLKVFRPAFLLKVLQSYCFRNTSKNIMMQSCHISSLYS